MTVAVVSSLVSGVTTISASFMTGAGEAQCQPITCAGRSVAAASAAIGNPDVFDAKIACGGASRSSSRNVRTFNARCSGTASMTRSTAAASANVAVNEIRSERGVGLCTRELVACDRTVEAEATGRDVLTRGVERGRRDVETHHVVARDRAHLRDPTPHDPRPQNPDLHFSMRPAC